MELYKTFYPMREFRDPASVAALAEWMLDTARLAHICTLCPEVVLLPPPPPPRLERVESFIVAPAPAPAPIVRPKQSVAAVPRVQDEIFPRQNDTLFWCCFIAREGAAEYEAVERNRSKNRELEEKQRVMEKLTQEPGLLRCAVPKTSLSAVAEIRSDVMTNATTNLKTFVALCACFRFRALVVDRRTRTFLLYDPDPADAALPTQIFYHHAGGRFSLDTHPTPAKIADVETSCTRLESSTKHFRAQSFYSAPALREIATKLGISEEKRTKDVLYAAVLEASEWK